MSSLSEATSLAKDPISFATTDIKSDTSIMVFDQAFHVHCLFLKIHSIFFRKFLDSPEKKGKTSSSSVFQYEWVTKVDDDGTWSLVCAPSYPEFSSTNPIKDFPGNISDEIEAFTSILQAMYSVPFTIKSVAHLHLATCLADYYCALPVLSHGISGALFTSPNFLKEIPDKCLEILPIALKLRSRVLYKDSLTWAMGPWSAPKYNILKDKMLKQYSVQAHQKLMSKVLEIERILKICQAGRFYPYMDKIYLPDFNTEYVKAINLAYKFNDQNTGVLRLALLFRSLYSSSGSASTLLNFIKSTIATVLENCLSLPTTHVIAGTKPYEDHFFCLELDDDDIPWDINERAW